MVGLLRKCRQFQMLHTYTQRHRADQELLTCCSILFMLILREYFEHCLDYSAKAIRFQVSHPNPWFPRLLLKFHRFSPPALGVLFFALSGRLKAWPLCNASSRLSITPFWSSPVRRNGNPVTEKSNLGDVTSDGWELDNRKHDMWSYWPNWQSSNNKDWKEGGW